MATYNQLHIHLQCPRCDRESDMVVNLYFGFRDQLDYSLGDKYQWNTGLQVEDGGRPPDGNLDGEGYTECPICCKDFFVIVNVRNDVLEGAKPNLAKKPLIPD